MIYNITMPFVFITSQLGIFYEETGMERKGMIHLYIGNGKGKTTAATGLAIRAVGWNLRVLFAQFLKNSCTGEKNILESFSGRVLFFRPAQRHKKFLWDMTGEELAETKEDIFNAWEKLRIHIQSGEFDVVILDEILDCIQNNLIDPKVVLKDITERPAGVEIVCTGRDAPKSFYDAADYITVMNSVKHPYERGIKARYGIEY